MAVFFRIVLAKGLETRPKARTELKVGNFNSVDILTEKKNRKITIPKKNKKDCKHQKYSRTINPDNEKEEKKFKNTREP